MKKLGLCCLLSPSVCYCVDTDIQLYEPISTLVIARTPGKIVEIMNEQGGFVRKGDSILSYKDQSEVFNILSPAEGVITLYSELLHNGISFNKGDFIVEISNQGISGKLTFDKMESQIYRLQEGKNYCCLYLNEDEFEIHINKIINVTGYALYYFSINSMSDNLSQLFHKLKTKNLNKKFVLNEEK